MSTRLSLSLLVWLGCSTFVVVTAQTLNITLIPAELGDFAPAAGAFGYLYEVVAPPTANAACFDNSVTGSGTQCNGTIDVDLALYTSITFNLAAPADQEIYLSRTGGRSEEDYDHRPLAIPIEFQGVFRNVAKDIGSAECGGRTQSISFANLSATVAGQLIAPLELVASGLPTSWWRSNVDINDNCQFSTKALFATPGNYTDNRFRLLSWTAEFDPTLIADDGVQTYAYDTAFTYSSVFNHDGRAVVVEQGGVPPPPPTSGASLLFLSWSTTTVTVSLVASLLWWTLV